MLEMTSFGISAQFAGFNRFLKTFFSCSGVITFISGVIFLFKFSISTGVFKNISLRMTLQEKIRRDKIRDPVAKKDS